MKAVILTFHITLSVCPIWQLAPLAPIAPPRDLFHVNKLRILTGGGGIPFQHQPGKFCRFQTSFASLTFFRFIRQNCSRNKQNWSVTTGLPDAQILDSAIQHFFF